MIQWLEIPNATKENAYREISAETGISAFAVEKDWWVVQTLSVVFDMDAAPHLVFKGGTSLSKVWKLIQRFSEDIDLAIDRKFFGFNGDLSKNQRDKLKKTAGRYIDEVFYPDLTKHFTEAGYNVNVVLEPSPESDRDRKISIYYPNVIPSPGYMKPMVQLEIGARSLREPFSPQSITSFLDEYYPGREFTFPPIQVPTVDPERTFLEKIFLLHEEFQRPPEKMRVDRLSRHLYDVYKLSKTKFTDRALDDKDLYNTIVDHRYHFNRVGGVDYNLHRPATINPIPLPQVIPEWEKDYHTMLEQMIYEKNPPSFEQLIEALTVLKRRINSLPWGLEYTYPVPDSKS